MKKIFATAILTLLFVLPSQAEQYNGSGNFDCQGQGQIAKSVANIRDANKPASKVLENLKFKGSPSARRMVEEIADAVYKSDWDAETAYSKIREKCEKRIKTRDAALNR
jgi:hypothetical protein